MLSQQLSVSEASTETRKEVTTLELKSGKVVDPSTKIKLQLFPVDEVTRIGLEKVSLGCLVCWNWNSIPFHYRTAFHSTSQNPWISTFHPKIKIHGIPSIFFLLKIYKYPSFKSMYFEC